MTSSTYSDSVSSKRSSARRWVHQIWSYAKELYLYAMMGGVVLGLDVFSFWLLVTFSRLHYLEAHLISRTMGGLLCFVLNRFVTFGKRGMDGILRDFLKFLMLYTMSFLLSSGLIYVGVQTCNLPQVASKVIAECIVFMFNYTVMKYWVMAKGDVGK